MPYFYTGSWELVRRGKRQGYVVIAIDQGKTELTIQFYVYMYSQALAILVSSSCYNKVP